MHVERSCSTARPTSMRCNPASCPKFTRIAVLLLCLPAVACTQAAMPTIDVPVATAAPSGSPLSELAPATGDDATFVGVVDEVLPAGGYTYLRVRTDAGDRWVATMGPGAAIGSTISVKNMGTRHDFHSRRLGRRFDTLAFGIVREA